MNSDIELPQKVLDHISLWAAVENKSTEQVIEELIVAGACAKLTTEHQRSYTS